MRIISYEEEIRELFLSLQANINSPLNEKLKMSSNILQMAKSLRVNHVIIKLLNFKEEFFQSFDLKESIRLEENLLNLSKVKRLNYYSLKNAGPLLLFRINSETTFDELKTKACALWMLNQSTYSIYDESFNNCDCCLDLTFCDFFLSYRIFDKMLKPGEVVFYLMEKTKRQKALTTEQMRCSSLTSNRQ